MKSAIPSDLFKLKARFEAWRKTRAKRSKTSDHLLKAAAALLNNYSASMICRVEDRHGSHSTIITSQLPISSWHDYLNDPTVADALLDRLLANAHRLELKGESLRKTRQKLTHREHSK